MDKEKRDSKSVLETRTYPFEINEVRTLEDDSVRITGYAAVYNQLSGDLGGFREKIKRGFFAPAIGRDDVRALINHDDNLILGRTTAKTLILEEDKKGLRVEILPADTTYEKDLITHMKRGDVDQMSFQFVTSKDDWDTSDMNNVVRTLVEIESLWDVSVVTFPAYDQTRAEANSAKQVYKNHLELELEEINKRKVEKDKEERYSKLSMIRNRLMLVKGDLE